jgi:uncharacterized repeat protein (TIGR04076 family)
MNKLTVSVTKILGACSGSPPVEKGDYFTVDNGDIRIPEGRFVCIWALQNILPLIPAKERKICESRKADWMWRIHHVQCPDPNGRVIFEIEKGLPKGASRKGTARGGAGITIKAENTGLAPEPDAGKLRSGSAVLPVPSVPADVTSSFTARRLRIVVDEVKGKCTSGLKRGDAFFLDGCRLTIPPGRHFCLYALQAVLPFVAAKERRLDKGDWLERDDRFICPDPAGNVILRLEILD